MKEIPNWMVAGLLAGAFLCSSTCVVPAHAQTDADSDGFGNRNRFRPSGSSGVDLSSIRLGQRIEVRLENGARFKGEVIGFLGDRIQLDISHENLSMSGTIMIRRDSIGSISPLDSLSAAERARVENVKEQYRSSRQRGPANGGSSEGEEGEESEATGEDTTSETAAEQGETSENQASGEGENGKSAKKEEKSSKKDEEKEGPPELTKEHRNLLETYPADEWTQKRYQKLSDKFNFQLNDREQTFLDRWKTIQEAREIQKKRRRYKLLQEFHPDDGWTPERYRHIKEDLAVMEAKGIPSRTAEQRRFLEVYPEWKKAYDKYKKKQESGEADSGGTSGEDTENAGSKVKEKVSGQTTSDQGTE